MLSTVSLHIAKFLGKKRTWHTSILLPHSSHKFCTRSHRETLVAVWAFLKDLIGGGTRKLLYTTYVQKRLVSVVMSWWTVSPPALMFLHPCLPELANVLREQNVLVYYYRVIWWEKNQQVEKSKSQKDQVYTPYLQKQHVSCIVQVLWYFSMRAASSIAGLYGSLE